MTPIPARTLIRTPEGEMSLIKASKRFKITLTDLRNAHLRFGDWDEAILSLLPESYGSYVLLEPEYVNPAPKFSTMSSARSAKNVPPPGEDTHLAAVPDNDHAGRTHFFWVPSIAVTHPWIRRFPTRADAALNTLGNGQIIAKVFALPANEYGQENLNAARQRVRRAEETRARNFAREWVRSQANAPAPTLQRESAAKELREELLNWRSNQKQFEADTYNFSPPENQTLTDPHDKGWLEARLTQRRQQTYYRGAKLAAANKNLSDIPTPDNFKWVTPRTRAKRNRS